MAEHAQYPYSEYKLYVVLHRKEGRRLACLVKAGSLERTTVSYARYLMSVHLGRLLRKDEQVDHIDGDKSNDQLSNLQILNQKQNLKKQCIELGKSAKWRTLKCPNCGIEFKRRAHRVDFKIQQGVKPCCSRKCGGQYSHR